MEYSTQTAFTIYCLASRCALESPFSPLELSFYGKHQELCNMQPNPYSTCVSHI